MEARWSINAVCKGTAVRWHLCLGTRVVGTAEMDRSWNGRPETGRAGPVTLPRWLSFWGSLGEGLKQIPTLAAWGAVSSLQIPSHQPL